MRDEHAVIADNLALWRADVAENRTLRHLQIAQAAERAAKSWLSQRSELPIDRALLPLDPSADGFVRALAIDEQVAFARAFGAACPSAAPQDATVTPAPHTQLRVLCSQGALASAAFHKLCKLLPGAQHEIERSFAAAAERAARDTGFLALLPLEDTKDGALTQIYALLERFELHILASCDVPVPEGTHRLRMALVGAAPWDLAPNKPQRMVECELFYESPAALSDFLLAAEACGLLLQRISALTSAHREDTFVARSAFLTDKDSLQQFALYIALFQPRAGITERYVHMGDT